MTERTTPYSADEKRVVDFISEQTNDTVGGGEDPIGFLMASHRQLAADRNAERVASSRLLKAQAKTDKETDALRACIRFALPYVDAACVAQFVHRDDKTDAEIAAAERCRCGLTNMNAALAGKPLPYPFEETP